MPLQNRVTPFGELEAVTGRGMFTGNRGRLHDGQRNVVRWADGRRWITCLLEFGGRHREVMAPNRYTELFFLDEVTALAAGHRPCFECRRPDYLAFSEAWRAGRGEGGGGADGDRRVWVRADELDGVLDAERRDGRTRRTTTAAAAELPDGAMVVLGGSDGDTAHLVLGGRLLAWSADGYGPSRPAPDGALIVLTPASTVGALAHGYRPALHPTAA